MEERCYNIHYCPLWLQEKQLWRTCVALRKAIMKEWCDDVHHCLVWPKKRQ